MTLTATMDTALSRVRLVADGLGAALTATVERSTDGIRWSTVRGGLDMPVSTGVVRLDDYEFEAGEENQYRVRYAATAEWVSSGTAAHAEDAPVTPGMPAGVQAGDTLVLLAATRASAQATPVPPPAGYTEIVSTTGNVRVSASIWDGVAPAPTINLTGDGGVGMSVSAQLAAFRGLADPAALAGALADVLSAPEQDISTPALTPGRDNSTLLWVGWKQDDWTSVEPPAGVPTEVGDAPTTLGDDQGITWACQVQTTATTVGASHFTVTGGAAAVTRGATVELHAGEESQSASITPTLDTVWLKNLGRAFLNRSITVVDWSDIEHPSRIGVFPIVGRSRAVGVTDVRTTRRYDLTVRFGSVAEAADFVSTLDVGDPIYLHVPPDCAFPGMYAVIGDVRMSRRQPRSTSRYVSLPLTEVAAPGPDVVPATATWQTVLDTYATWADVIAAHSTWFDVLDLIGQPDEVIIS